MASSRLNEVSFADIATFLAVRRYQSISGAARELNVTPSQVSKAIVRLEGQIGITLLSRGARGVAITSDGRRIAPMFDGMVSQLRDVRRSHQPARVELTVAAPSYLSAAFLPVIASCLPQVRVRGLELPPPLVRAYAAENFFDLTITTGMNRLPKPWVSEQVGHLRGGLFATPAVVQRLGRPPIAAEALHNELFVSPVYYANGQFVAVDDGCPLGAGEREVGHEAATFALAIELAVQSGQLVFGPAVAAHGHVKRKLLAEIHVKGWDVKEPLFLACNGDRVMARVQTAVIHALKEALAQIP